MVPFKGPWIGFSFYALVRNPSSLQISVRCPSVKEALLLGLILVEPELASAAAKAIRLPIVGLVHWTRLCEDSLAADAGEQSSTKSESKILSLCGEGLSAAIVVLDYDSHISRVVHACGDELQAPSDGRARERKAGDRSPHQPLGSAPCGCQPQRSR